MNVFPLESPSLFTVARARNAAADLEPALAFLRLKTIDALEGVRKAKTIDKVVVRYAAWLGQWHRCNVKNTFAMHLAGSNFSDGRLVVAVLQIKTEISGIVGEIAQPSHWIAMPNLEATRHNIVALLSNVETSIDNALASCAVLEGRISSEGEPA